MARPGHGRGGRVRGRPAVRARRLPARGDPRPGRGPLGPRVRPDRLGQDAGGRVRRAPGPVRAGQGLLHHAAQGALEPEVRRAGRLLRRGARRAADGRHHAAPPGARRRHDDRGAAQHAAGRLRPPRGPAHGRARRGPLHSGPLPGRGVGRGPRPVAPRSPLRLPVGHGQQRRRARWLAAVVRGDTAVIVERHRPIVLRHHFAVHRREDDETVLLPLLQRNGRPGGEGLRIDQAVRRALQGGAPRTGSPEGGDRACPSAPHCAPR